MRVLRTKHIARNNQQVIGNRFLHEFRAGAPWCLDEQVKRPIAPVNLEVLTESIANEIAFTSIFAGKVGNVSVPCRDPSP